MDVSEEPGYALAMTTQSLCRECGSGYLKKKGERLGLCADCLQTRRLKQQREWAASHQRGAPPTPPAPSSAPQHGRIGCANGATRRSQRRARQNASARTPAA
jgi:hypothetical protein